MRFRFDPTAEQRAALQAQLARLQQPAELIGLLRGVLPDGFTPASVACTVHSVHSDRFVVRGQLRSSGGEELGYALKAYADDFGDRVWAYSRLLTAHFPATAPGLCMPIRYLPDERVLVFPWVEGRQLSKIVDEGKPQLLEHAATVAASLHRLRIVPDELTTAHMLVEQTRTRCDGLRPEWPAIADLVEPLLEALQAAVPDLDVARPAPVHGDLAAGQFLWTGDRLVLLDLDMFGYADPAYDVGHCVAQLERRCVLDRTLPAGAADWPACFRDAYLAAMPQVSARNVSFYQSLTLVRKTYTVCRRQPADGPNQARRLAARARAALEGVGAPAGGASR